MERPSYIAQALAKIKDQPFICLIGAGDEPAFVKGLVRFGDKLGWKAGSINSYR